MSTICKVKDFANIYLSSAIHINYVPHEVACVFVVVFISSVIQITLVFSICLFLLSKIITDTVWFQVTLPFADILIAGANGSYHVILQPAAMNGSTDES